MVFLSTPLFSDCASSTLNCFHYRQQWTLKTQYSTLKDWSEENTMNKVSGKISNCGPFRCSTPRGLRRYLWFYSTFYINNQHKKISEYLGSVRPSWTDFFNNSLPVGGKFTLSDKISADKTAENLTCCRIFCPQKSFVRRKFCLPKYFVHWNSKHVKLI